MLPIHVRTFTVPKPEPVEVQTSYWWAPAGLITNTTPVFISSMPIFTISSLVANLQKQYENEHDVWALFAAKLLKVDRYLFPDWIDTISQSYKIDEYEIDYRVSPKQCWISVTHQSLRILWIMLNLNNEECAFQVSTQNLKQAHVAAGYLTLMLD